MIFSFLSARYFIRSFENTCLTIESTGIHLLIFKVLDTAILAKEILFCAFLIMFSFTINVFPLYLKLWGKIALVFLTSQSDTFWYSFCQNYSLIISISFATSTLLIT